jgi:hypothetical protein
MSTNNLPNAVKQRLIKSVILVNIEMKPIKYLLILLVLASLNSCMVGHTSYANIHRGNSKYYRNWAINSYSSVHARPPIN